VEKPRIAVNGENFVTSGNARLWSMVSGKGTPVLFFNGGPGCDDYLEPVAKLMDSVCQVIRFEPRGCGRSDWDGNYDLDTLLEDAEALRKAYGFDHWILLGHSAGPDVALAYALQYPARTIGIIGLAGGRIINDREWHEVYRTRLASIGEDSGGKIFHADPEVNRQGNASWRAYCKRPFLLRELATLEVPCVFINASEDIRPNWPTRQLANLLPNGKYLEIAEAAHTIWLTHAKELQYELLEAVNYMLAIDKKAKPDVS
jgi:proline iminopeptidase